MYWINLTPFISLILKYENMREQKKKGMGSPSYALLKCKAL